MKKLKIAAAGGVTGGHLYPNIAVLEEFQKRYDIEILYFCVSGKIEERLLPVVHPEFKRYTINVKGLRRPVFHPENIIRFSKLISNSKKIQEELKKFSPDFVYVSGGYVSYPVAKAAKRLGIPVFVQEQNTLPGKANIAISKFAKRVFLSFEESIQRFPKKIHNKIEVVGNPIWARDGKVELPHPTVIVIGGSGGSEFLNKITLEIALEMPDVNFILSSGGKKLDGTVPNNVQVKDYIDNMYAYWRSVDAAITRGGATTISELIYFNVPAIVVPWEGSTESHQILNAKIIEKEQLGVMIRENEYNKEKFVQALRGIINKGRKFEERTNPAIKIVESISSVLGL
ncbi:MULTISPECIES: UDP-N-acetylglucosamine--N-acetylmuramyl-(pentapeptide) pyrophosphoryl-undecaprenol N-acetylglucosamine transferase [Fervidobacterium]|uniref:UDP-N-acetylglucosamine--N-acetylmuramyl-(pentapeptide) pyrophosphoryl-undecaprenol N-acetylglucosamine transferase n=1 Tax=Fervidobacterium nodosum (strain ATCC 35602 / DSM 5306 / Rt17-B1) TaxID=381764 RepID=A7HMD6_FERNB|nr:MULTISPECIES: UDP-N-acetylglucosamine--N-acetylmuramyl-(pentapeptide) pyrophosphoryl-undecaprenol N-acetylglucosamine transferase [Fervidobacterium]ABS61069.1 Undecaprenyldiphospho-muramoylpentapeptide beta-N-acetylglucosaminyltransferase [Fervidobacterium nodosum Rt17-B1]KAF2962402.1 UDP-N-acetylglucosamine--N-acetylmuramyl-(pentapeptide) pyrophosphoryl-undecaprenol N-acetylglucosamine transferase [Fervidobacterium sp. 2310opik-2]